MRFVLTVLASLMLVGLSFSALLVLVAFFRGLPVEESRPAPRPAGVRRLVAIGPPASRAARVKARLTVCRTAGHRWAVAYPLPGSQRMRQCQACGTVEAPVVVESYRTGRA